MKRIIACLMAGVMLLALVGCGGSGSSGSMSGTKIGTVNSVME